MPLTDNKREIRDTVASRRRRGRENLLFANRHISSPDYASNESSDVSSSFLRTGQFSSLFHQFRKPNSAQCLNALRVLNFKFFSSTKASFQNCWIDEFFSAGDRTIHSIVGIVTNFNLDDARTQVEAAVCLSNLCCTKDAKQRLILTRSAAPYFVTFLADGPETTRISLAVACLQGLGNLASETGQNEQVCRRLVSLNALETVGAMVGHSDREVWEAALFALETILGTLVSNSVEMASSSTKNLIRFRPKFVSEFYKKLSELCSNDESSSSSVALRRTARSLFLFAGLEGDPFPDPSVEQLRLLLTVIERVEAGHSSFGSMFYLWRSVGVFLSRETAGEVRLDFETAYWFLRRVVQFLDSPYVPLRKETVWVLLNFLADRHHCEFLFGSNDIASDTTPSSYCQNDASILLAVISGVVKVGKLTLCEETRLLCSKILFILDSDASLKRLAPPRVRRDMSDFFKLLSFSPK